ncbi:MAG: type III-B CRISPR module RAMP protein Cmr6, partial [Archaeoglobaceae archaeon]
LPKTLQKIWQQVWNDNRCKNLSLLIDRYGPWTKVGDEWNLRMRYRRGQKEETAEGQSAKSLWLRNKTDETMIHLPICPNERIDVGILTAVKQRHEALLQWYRQRGFEVRQFEAKPAWRFVVGLGAAHVLETSITLHRIFGLPIIPASGLKGAARAYAQLIEGKSENDQEFIAIFGTTKQTGKIVFLDALPTQPPKFTLDIMNPHFPDYYRTKGKEAPSDWQSPKPVFFLTVSEINYLFAIAARTNDANDLLLTAEEWLKGALRELGIGAKTSANYGYWDV